MGNNGTEKGRGYATCVPANKTHSSRFRKPVEEEGAPLGSRCLEHAQDKNVATVTNLQGKKVVSILSGSEEVADRRGSIFKSCGGLFVM